MEYPECEQLLAAAARNRIGYLELSETRRYPDYSTCTFNAHEDEENVDWICEELGAEVMALEV